jgi:hypothetical protein
VKEEGEETVAPEAERMRTVPSAETKRNSSATARLRGAHVKDAKGDSAGEDWVKSSCRMVLDP